MNQINLGDALRRVCQEIETDKDFRLMFEANIAMAFKDQFNFSGHKHNCRVVHEVANKAAAAFLDLLIGKDMGDANGMAAIINLHKQAKPASLTDE